MERRTAKAPDKQLAYIDNARGIAILLVLLVHANQHVTGLSPLAHAIATFGQSGVQLFFVASAFTLCLSMGRSRKAVSLVEYWIKRLFRIAPMYYVAIALYLIAHLVISSQRADNGAAAAAYTWPNVLANLLFVHGFVPAANNNVVPGGWSIGTEVAFYLCFPLIFVLFQRLRTLGSVWLGWPVLVAFCLNIAAQVWLHRGLGVDNDNNTFVFYHLLNQMPVFLLGIVLYFLTEDARRPALSVARRHLWLGFTASLAMTTSFWLSSYDLAFAFVPLTLGLTFAFLLALMRDAQFNVDWLGTIGRLSYSIYVVHFVITWMTMDVVNRAFRTTTSPEVRWLSGFALIALFSVIVARFTQRAVETPGVAAGQRLIEARRRRLGRQQPRDPSRAGHALSAR